MQALIDGDIFAYEMGGLKKKTPDKGQEEICPGLQEGETLPFEVCWGVVENKIKTILQATGADSYTVYLSSPTHKTWRYVTASILPYKGNREGKEKPPYWALIVHNLILHHHCEIAEGIEADDAMSITQYQDLNRIDPNGHPGADWLQKEEANTVICSRDKDLSMVPGWHYSWACGKSKEQPMWWQDEIGGLQCFYKQLLTGDTVDNIPGLFGVGEKSTLVKKLMEFSTEAEMFAHTFKQYSDRFGSYSEQFIRENGRLLWMQRDRQDRWDGFEELMRNVVD